MFVNINFLYWLIFFAIFFDFIFESLGETPHTFPFRGTPNFLFITHERRII